MYFLKFSDMVSKQTLKI